MSSDSGSKETNLGELAKKYKWALVAVLVVLALIFLFVQKNSVTNAGNRKQQQLIAYYNETENVLSDCLFKTKQSIGATGAQTSALDKVLTDAVKGRYEAGSSAKPGSGNPLFSAILEAYPETAGLSKTFQDVLVTINGCRTDFKNSQSVLQTAVARFNEWREGSFMVRTFGGGNYPNSKLAIKVGTKVLTGNEALSQMRTLVVVSQAEKARETNKIENENPFEK